jgi:hypothetical protein
MSYIGLSATPTNAGTIVNIPGGDVAASTVQGAINELDTEKVPRTSTVGSAQLPAGTTAQQDGPVGSVRYNSTFDRFEGKASAGYGALGGGATGGGGDTVFQQNNTVVNNPHTIPVGVGASIVGAPSVTFNAAVTVNGRLVIL